METEKIQKIVMSLVMADSLESVQNIVKENGGADVFAQNPVLTKALSGALATFAYKGGVNLETLGKRAEANEKEIIADAENILAKHEIRREMYRLAGMMAEQFRKLYPGRDGAVQVEVKTTAVAEMENVLPPAVATAASRKGIEAKAIRKSKGFNVKTAKKRKKTEESEA